MAEITEESVDEAVQEDYFKGYLDKAEQDSLEYHRLVSKFSRYVDNSNYTK